MTPTHEEIREMLRDQRKDLVMDMEKANERANKPIERRLEEISVHLRDLNGKVATHAIKHAETDIRMAGVREQVLGILEDRRKNLRREEDRLSAEEGDNRRITQREVKLVIAVIGGYSAVLFTVWKVIPALIRAIQP